MRSFFKCFVATSPAAVLGATLAGLILAGCADTPSLNPEANLLIPIGAEPMPEVRPTPAAPAPEGVVQISAVSPMAVGAVAAPGVPILVPLVVEASPAGIMPARLPVPRLAPLQPDDVSAVGYTDNANISGSLTRDLQRELKLALAGGDVEWSVRDASGHTIPFVRTRGLGDPYRIPAHAGAPFTLVFRNLRNIPYEVVATVDGRDVLTGLVGSVQQRGYVLGPLETLEIAGYRNDRSAATVSAPFQFRLHGPLLAAEIETGAARNVGVIGVALYKLALAPPNPFPADPLLVQTVVVPVRSTMP
ncbi:MAG: hypothetical protein ABIW85_05205 [Variovorax sp.]